MKKEKLLQFEHREIIEKYLGKIPILEIAKKINKSKHCIYSEIKKNEKPYNALKAQKRSDEVMKNKMIEMSRSRSSVKKKRKNQTSDRQISFLPEENHEELKKSEKKQQPKTDDSLETRIRNIEFQIEIIFDTLKEMKNDKKNKKL